MSILRRLAFAMLMVFGLTLVTSTPAAASGADYSDKQGEIRVCKVLKDGKDGKYDKGDATFVFVIREKKANGERDKYKFDITVKAKDDKKCSDKFKVDKGAYVVREKVANGYKLHDIEVKGCYYKDRNDHDAKVVVDVPEKHKCTVTFTNKKDDRK